MKVSMPSVAHAELARAAIAIRVAIRARAARIVGTVCLFERIRGTSAIPVVLAVGRLPALLPGFFLCIFE